MCCTTKHLYTIYTTLYICCTNGFVFAGIKLNDNVLICLIHQSRDDFNKFERSIISLACTRHVCMKWDPEWGRVAVVDTDAVPPVSLHQPSLPSAACCWSQYCQHQFWAVMTSSPWLSPDKWHSLRDHPFPAQHHITCCSEALAGVVLSVHFMSSWHPVMFYSWAYVYNHKPILF